MQKKIITFIFYNNIIPLVLGGLFLSSGIVFAASKDVRGIVSNAVYTSNKVVVSIDNSYIANKDLTNYSPRVSITTVTEDADFYYVSYNFHTIALKDSAWQEVNEIRKMEVDKNALKYGKIGLAAYVTEQLRQDVVYEKKYLKNTQEIERENVTQKVVATVHTGLVGKLIDDTTEKLPEYVPPVLVSSNQSIIATSSNATVVNSENIVAVATATAKTFYLTMLGLNPSRIPLGSSYNDLGAVAISNNGLILNLSIAVSVNNKKVSIITIDTKKVGEWIIEYSATNIDGSIAVAKRVVQVFDPNTNTTTTATSSPATPVTSQSATTTTSTSTAPPNTVTGTTTATSSPATPVTSQSATTTSTSTAPPNTVTGTTTATSSPATPITSQSATTTSTSTAPPNTVTGTTTATSSPATPVTSQSATATSTTTIAQ